MEERRKIILLLRDFGEKKDFCVDILDIFHKKKKQLLILKPHTKVRVTPM